MLDIALDGEIMIDGPTGIELIKEAQASFDQLRARLQALDAKHCSSLHYRSKSASAVVDHAKASACSLSPVESGALTLFVASASALLRAGEALIDARVGVPARARAAGMADLVRRTKDACRTAYQAALLLTDGRAATAGSSPLAERGKP